MIHRNDYLQLRLIDLCKRRLYPNNNIKDYYRLPSKIFRFNNKFFKLVFLHLETINL